MTPALSSSDAFAYVIVAVLGFIILRRAYFLTQGTRVSTGRLVILPIFYLLIYAAELAATGFAGAGSSAATPVYLSFVGDGALVVAGVFLAFQYTLRHLTIYQRPGETAWSYRMNALLPVIYVVLFFVRVAIETALLGEGPFTFPAPGALDGISAFALYSLLAVNALWGLSTGFLIGRSAAVYREWQQHLASPGSSAAPLPP
ncbi:MAG: hypothetical protein WBF81_07700 [Thermoplasmata archaeon]